MIPKVILFLSALTVTSCSHGVQLTQAEKIKLDPALQYLLTHDDVPETDYDVAHRSDGSKEYGLIIHSSDVEEVRAAGINVESVFGEIVTVRVTIAELRKLCTLMSVHAVRNGSKNYPHQ